jgi:hypothetical protein
MAPQFLVECLGEVYAGGQWFEQRTLSDAMDKRVPREAAPKGVSALLRRARLPEGPTGEWPKLGPR